MSFESEILIARLRPRGSRLVLPTGLLLVASFLASFLTGRFEGEYGNLVVYSICGALALFGFGVPLLRYLTTWTDITNSRVVQRSGLFGGFFQSVALAEIERVELASIGVITLYVSSSEPIELRGLPRTRLVAEEISRLVQRRTGK